MVKALSPALLAPFVLAGAILAGCGSDDEASKTTSVKRSAASAPRTCPAPEGQSPYPYRFRFRNETSVPVMLSVNPQSWKCRYREDTKFEGYSGTENPDALNGLMVPAGGEASRTLEYARVNKNYKSDWGGFVISFYGVVNGKPRIMPIEGTPALNLYHGRCVPKASTDVQYDDCYDYTANVTGDKTKWFRKTFRTTLPNDQQANLRFDGKADPDEKNVIFTLSPR